MYSSVCNSAGQLSDCPYSNFTLRIVDMLGAYGVTYQFWLLTVNHGH